MIPILLVVLLVMVMWLDLDVGNDDGDDGKAIRCNGVGRLAN